MSVLKTTLMAVALCASISPRLSACEACANYAAPSTLGGDNDSWHMSFFSRYSVMDQRIDGTDTLSDNGEEIKSWYNIATLGYSVSPSVHLDVSLPILSRDFTQLEGGQLVSGSESGIGDLNLRANWTAHLNKGADSAQALTLIAGIKAPTGDTDRLDDGSGHHEEDESSHDTMGDGHHGASAISGHDLTLGSGSWDVIAGIDWQHEQEAYFTGIRALYYLRTEGDHDYQFSDDFFVTAHIGRILMTKDDCSLSGRIGLSGEFRDADEQNGEKIEHTDLESIYGTGTLTATHKAWIAELGVDIPIRQHVADVTLVPEFRTRAAIGVQF
jgi:hypothetical protein